MNKEYEYKRTRRRQHCNSLVPKTLLTFSLIFVMIGETRKGRHFFMTRLLILGGSDAGISAALRAREVDPSTQVAVVIADSFPNYSICGLPFYLSGEVSDSTISHIAQKTRSWMKRLDSCWITLHAA